MLMCQNSFHAYLLALLSAELLRLRRLFRYLESLPEDLAQIPVLRRYGDGDQKNLPVWIEHLAFRV